tara:strand:- start:3342 stop:3845 length:504 start_codon:yes stop_codon:yes gene_type:complete
MLKQLNILAIATITFGGVASAESVPITGTVQSKCSIFTDVQGVYGSPTPYELSTDRVDGGVMPVIRYDVAAPDYYKAVISYPNSFSSSPVLADQVAWTGDVTVSEVSDVLMANYETAKIQYDNTTEFDLTVAGTSWFEVESKALYGYNKAFPAGDYASIAVAECIAK